MSYSYGKSIVTDGLVFYVDAANSKSYPGTGTTWSDLIGSNDGTLTNGPIYDSANGGSIVFDGVNDRVLGGGLTNGGGSGTSQSYNIWFKASALNVTQGLFFWDDNNGVAFHYGSNTNEIFIQTNGGNSLSDFSPAPTVSLNTWHNAAFNFNQGSSYECWFDGTYYGSGATSDTSPQPSASTPFSIGIRIVGPSNYKDPLNGNVAVVAAYNRALSSAEVLQNYNALKNRFV